MLQYVAVFYSVLQCVVACCSVLHLCCICVAMYCSVLHVQCSALQRDALRCIGVASVLQCVAFEL